MAELTLIIIVITIIGVPIFAIYLNNKERIHELFNL